ncbi:isoprenyl transferase [Flavobacterium gilvum]|uniref:Isoprenyl transferase n=1 Tax=Flavobacterium gilvum TaxID=1492737 RepID=A0AAC9I2V6_9FLAO|nr:isoprenyl transferase [Flavobacterium gilvum]AOW09196.1 di-trans,poly-cis-decaprenylcistransferase [Flavobacterium gilvum]KFC59203.1 UDP pyrophosphate synthase [Flavobacterium gilvum]
MLKEQINKDNIPKHLAIIMDGNGRWAKQKGFIRTLGHESGSKTVKKIIKECSNLGIEYLTLYAFSTENWNRPKLEVDTLMKVLIHNLKKELKTMEKDGVKMNAIGNLEKLPENAQKQLQEVIDRTKNNTKLTLTLALSYGAREELVNAVRIISDKVKNNIISIDSIDDSIINEHLYTRDMPDVDLLIRTSGEYRISNFLLWQIAYSELYFTDVLWPDFKEKELHEAIIDYQKRERRFGKTSEQIK